ncbi:MAG TPA: HAD-IA family hydrolase [Jatrophihabitantaceae bacterium]|nr:HAD-IA family hydrolase [Jatrophihabitantaceae bacterium]
MAIDAVIFDWGGTLTPWHTIDQRESWLAATGDPALADRLSAAEDLAWTRSRDEYTSATLAEVLQAAGVDADDRMLADYHEWWEPHTLTDPDVPELFAWLREQGIRIGVLSNTIWPKDRHEQIFERDEVLALIDGAVYTSEIAWTKPHAEAFRAALAAVGVADPSRAVYVGDRPFDDIHGAKSVGMRAVLVPHSTVPEWQRGHTEGEPDAVIERLADLRTVIEGWL